MPPQDASLQVSPTTMLNRPPQEQRRDPEVNGPYVVTYQFVDVILISEEHSAEQRPTKKRKTVNLDLTHILQAEMSQQTIGKKCGQFNMKLT